MTITETIQKDMTEAMKARDERRLSALRMMRSSLKNKEIDKRSPLEEKEELAVLSTMIKQRKESIEQFLKGERQDLAEKERAEIEIIERYMPKALGEEEVAATVRQTIAEMGSPTLKDMGTVMKNVMAKFHHRRRPRGRQTGQRKGETGAGKIAPQHSAGFLRLNADEPETRWRRPSVCGRTHLISRWCSASALQFSAAKST